MQISMNKLLKRLSKNVEYFASVGDMPKAELCGEFYSRMKKFENSPGKLEFPELTS
jgi:hypothetical protein